MGRMDGVIVLDKPAGISSHDAVQQLRRITGVRKVGHLGTLDPLATGVLPLVIGKATRLSQFFLGHDRSYEAEIRCGFATDTFDREGWPTTEPVEVVLNAAEVESALERFRGRFSQTPPPVSAKKVGGKPAYKLARRGQEVELEPVEVEVYELELMKVAGDRLTVRVRCSAGTYLRSLAHDLGSELGCGAHVTELRRTAVGEFDLSMAWTLGRLQELRDEGRLSEALVPATAILPEIPARRVDAAAAGRIAHGRDFQVAVPPEEQPVRRVKAIGPDGRLLAIGEIRLPHTYHPIIVF